MLEAKASKQLTHYSLPINYFHHSPTISTQKSTRSNQITQQSSSSSSILFSFVRYSSSFSSSHSRFLSCMYFLPIFCHYQTSLPLLKSSLPIINYSKNYIQKDNLKSSLLIIFIIIIEIENKLLNLLTSKNTSRNCIGGETEKYTLDHSNKFSSFAYGQHRLSSK